MGNDLAKNAIAIGLARRIVTRKDRQLKNQYLKAQIDSLKADAKAAERKLELQDMGLDMFGMGKQDPGQDFTGGGAVQPAPTPAPTGGQVPLPQAIAQGQMGYQIDPNALLKGNVQAMEMDVRTAGDYSVVTDPYGREVSRKPIQRFRKETEYREGGILHIDPNSRNPVAQTLMPKHYDEPHPDGGFQRVTYYEPAVPGLPVTNIAEVMREVNEGRARWKGPPFPGMRPQQTAGTQRSKLGAAEMVVPNPEQWVNDESGQTLAEAANYLGLELNEITRGLARKMQFHEYGELDKPAKGVYVDDSGEVILGVTAKDVFQGTATPANTSQIAMNKVISKEESELFRNAMGQTVPLGTKMGAAADMGYSYYHKNAVADAELIKSGITPALYDMYAEGLDIIADASIGGKIADSVYFAYLEKTGGAFLSKEDKVVAGRVKAYNDLQRAVTANFAKSVGGESGVLTDKDREYAQNFFIILSGAGQDTLESGNKKMANIVQHMNGKTAAKNMPWLKMRSFEEMQRLGWKGPGDYSFTDKNGVTYEVTAKSASDYNRYLNLAEYVGVK